MRVGSECGLARCRGLSNNLLRDLRVLLSASGMIKLRPFQKESVRKIYQFRGRALLADEQGLGKTAEALAWLRAIPSRRPVVIVCPSSVKWEWQSEAQNHFGIHLSLIEGRKPGRVKSIQGGFFVINYDILPSWLPVLLKLKPKAVVVDEGHYIKNLRALRTKAVYRLQENADSVLILTGTPITNRLVDLFPMLNILRPDIWPSFHSYVWSHCQPRHTRYGWQFKGAVRKKKLRRKMLKYCMIRRLKKDVAPELPDKTHKIIPVKLTKSDYAEYKEARDKFIQWLQKKSPAKAERARRAQAISKIGYLIRLAAQLKLNWTIKWVKEWAEANPGKKLVGLSLNTFVIDRLRAEFPNSVYIDGRVTGKNRQLAKRQFQTDPDTLYFWGNAKAAGIGLTLTASHYLVFFDLPWDPGTLLQAQDRIHRIGQKYKAVIAYLLALGTVEEAQMKALRDKTAILEAVIDGKRSSRDLDILDDLLKSFKKG